MKRLVLSAAAAAACALPASAMASPSAGVVLAVSPQHHAIQVVDGSHVVHSYRYHGTVRSAHPGSRVHFKRQGGSIGQVKVSRRPARTVTFLATVKQVTARTVTLRLSDGRQLTFKASQVHFAGTLTPGMNVLATELLRGGHPQGLRITVSHAAASQGGGSGKAGSGSTPVDHSPSVSGPIDVNGTITKMTDSSVTITSLADGSTMQFVVNPDDDLTDGYLLGDQVTVTYNKLQDGALKASDIEYFDQDVVGTVLAVTSGSVTIQVDGTNAVETLIDDPSDDMFDGVNVGDQEVDVTYHVAAAGLIVDGIDD
ncbi:MAG TPA: hypothetical protein VGI87_04645 [Solirubrobacteraceae bacterium]|jgi:preprotein translocase subunit YajC